MDVKRLKGKSQAMSSPNRSSIHDPLPTDGHRDGPPKSSRRQDQSVRVAKRLVQPPERGTPYAAAPSAARPSERFQPDAARNLSTMKLEACVICERTSASARSPLPSVIASRMRACWFQMSRGFSSRTSTSPITRCV